MKFVVRWKELAIDDLAASWLNADSAQRRRITAAANEIGRLLQRDPDAQGESREADRRILFVAPLAVTFRVDADTRRVEVLHVRHFH